MPGATGDGSEYEDRAPRKVGVIVGEARPNQVVVACTGRPPPRWEYVTFKVPEYLADGREELVDVVGLVTLPVASSKVIRADSSPDVVAAILRENLVDVTHSAVVRVLGYVDPITGTPRVPRTAPLPGTQVYVAPAEVLRRFFDVPAERRIHVGHLITRPDVDVGVDVNGFRRHVAVLAATGAGKSYTTGLIMEQIIQMGGNVVIIDPHADYVFLGMRRDGDRLAPEPWADRVAIYHVSEKPHYADVIPKARRHRFSISVSDVGDETLLDILEIDPKWTWVRAAMAEALRRAKTAGRWSVSDIEAFLDDIAADAAHPEEMRRGAVRAKMRVRNLGSLSSIGPETTRLAPHLSKPGRAAVIDLSGATDREIDAITKIVAEEVMSAKLRRELRYPIFFVVEEAHRVIPRDGSSLAKPAITRIAREGRKFGVFLVVVSQRPSIVDPNVLSMCQSAIVMRTLNPEDQVAIRRAVEKAGEELLSDLPGLNVGEAVLVGDFVPMPMLVRVTGRVSAEGGADIDVAAALRDARLSMAAEDDGEDVRGMSSLM